MSHQSWICHNTQHRSVRLSYSRTEIRLLVHCLNCGFNSKYVLREFILIFLKEILSYNGKKSQFSMFYLLCFESKLKQSILVKGLYIAITWTLKTLKNRLYRALKFNPSVNKKVFGVLWRSLQKCSFVNVEMIRLPINFLYIARLGVANGKIRDSPRRRDPN